MIDFSNNYNKVSYLEFGKKEGNYPPAFSMKLSPADMNGHVVVEVDIEIADNDKRDHHCVFNIESELGTIERLGIELKQLVFSEEGTVASLLKNE